MKTDTVGRITWYANSRAMLEPRFLSQQGRLKGSPGNWLLRGQAVFWPNVLKDREDRPDADIANESEATCAAVIVVAVDFSPASLDAVRVGASVARHTEAKLILCHAIFPKVVPLGPGSPPWITQALRTEAQKQMEVALKLTEDAGVTALSVIEEGSPARAILNVAGRFGADLIILAARERGPWTRLLLGPSATEAVTREAESPVMILRPSHG
jgi:nucleotide-binding universal stress UspA family protein